MRALLLSALLSASPPSPAEAQKLAAQHNWDELYITWAAVKPPTRSPAERHTIAALLLSGCEELAGSDAVMAYALAERSVRFNETVPGLRCLVRTALATDQRGSAEEFLRQGMKHFPTQGYFALELGRLLLDDQDPVGALGALRRVSPRAPEAPQAQELAHKAQSLGREQQAARAGLRSVEQRFTGEADTPTPPTPSSASGLTYESNVGEDGMRTRANGRFTVRYFNNERDFGQRADYEGRIVAALDEAWGHTRQVLGHVRENPVDVVLYTREEFRTHLGPALARAAAGLYSDGAIRINDAAELTPQTRATLVHEYVHAVVDELVGPGGDEAVPIWLHEGLAEYVEWRYLGSDGPPYVLANRLRGAAQAGQLPSLNRLSKQALIHQADPGLVYALSAMAVRELLNEGGPGRLLDLIRQVGQGTPFEDALRQSYGKSVSQLDEELEETLSRR